MKRLIGTRSIGLRAPIIEKGDDLVEIVFDSVKNACKNHEIEINDKKNIYLNGIKLQNLL